MGTVAGAWSEVEVAGHPAEVFQPAECNPHGYVVLYLHGAHGHRLADQPAFTALFERHGLRVVAPITGRSWWTNRICATFDQRVTPEQHVVHGVMPFIRDQWQTEPPRIGLLGTSMGGQGALRMAYKYPNIFPVVAALSPAIDLQYRWDEDPVLQQMYADPESARQESALLYVHPLNWPRHQLICCDPTDFWWDSVDRLLMKLSSLGVPYEADIQTSHGGHGFVYYNHMAERTIAFLIDRLDRERLKLPIH